MPDRPLIVLPAPGIASRSRPFGGGTPPHFPSRARQGQRLTPRFETLHAYFQQRSVELLASAAGQIPEEVIVFETVGSVTNFLDAARRIPGLDLLTVTLAWFSPIHPRHRNYRQAAVWFDIEHEKLRVKRQEAEWKLTRNGTLQHEVLEGEQAAPFAEDETMLVKVNCRSDAGVLEGTVRYGLLVTIEVAEQLGIPIYDEIAARIRPAVQVRSAA